MQLAGHSVEAPAGPCHLESGSERLRCFYGRLFRGVVLAGTSLPKVRQRGSILVGMQGREAVETRNCDVHRCDLQQPASPLTCSAPGRCCFPGAQDYPPGMRAQLRRAPCLAAGSDAGAQGCSLRLLACAIKGCRSSGGLWRKPGPGGPGTATPLNGWELGCTRTLERCEPAAGALDKVSVRTRGLRATIHASRSSPDPATPAEPHRTLHSLP